MVLFISYITVLLIAFLISRHDEDAQWRDEAYQKNRVSKARRLGYDPTAKSIRKKFHNKYGYTYDREMKNQPYDITYEEWKKKRGE